ncbi:T9SS type A sorting domain-containing protein [bacterium]|nr:T9SS type A sorting domain-containing protein [bacterium]
MFQQVIFTLYQQTVYNAYFNISRKEDYMFHKIKNALYISIIIILTSVSSFSQTNVSGTIINGNWTTTNSPYIVVGDILVASLTINPGVVIRFAGDYVFEVVGILSSKGTEQNPILFTKNGPDIRWGGIYANSAQSMELAYCRIEWSQNGGVIIKSTSATIDFCRIIYNYALRTSTPRGGGVQIEFGSDVVLTNCVIDSNVVDAYTHNYGGAVSVNDAEVTLKNSILANNEMYAKPGSIQGGGIFIQSGTADVENCVITGTYLNTLSDESGGGLYMGASSSATVKNSIIFNNGNSPFGYQWPTSDSSNIQITFSCIEFGYQGEGNISFNPLFADEQYNLLDGVSPCIDKGDQNSIYNDPEDQNKTGYALYPALGNTRNDMGAYGGPASSILLYNNNILGLEADFSANHSSGYAPLAVQFTDKSTGVIRSRSWDFGDGNTSMVQNPVHTYNTADTFTVSLTVTGSEGTDTEIKENYIIIRSNASAQLADSPWPMLQHDAQHTGRSSAPGISQPVLKWEFQTKSKYAGSPVIGPDGTIYLLSGLLFSDTTGFLYAINPDGTEKWCFELNGPPSFTTPAITCDGTIYVHCNPKANIASMTYLYAINSDGTLKWVFDIGVAFTSYEVSSPVIGPDGTIYFGSMNTLFYAISPNGELKSARDINNHSSIDWSPAISPNGTIHVYSPSISNDGTFYEGGIFGLYAYNPNGELKWEYSADDFDMLSIPSIDSDNTIYLTSYRGLNAFNPNGQLKWHYPTWSGANCGAPTIAGDGTIYFRDCWTFYAIDRNGNEKWAIRGGMGTSSVSARQMQVQGVPIDSDGTLYINTRGSLLAYSDESTSVDLDISTNRHNGIPDNYALFQNYPNPFNPSTQIEYVVKEPCKVNLVVYNVTGQVIMELVNSYQQPKKYSIKIDMQDIPSGIYFYKIHMGDFQAVKKMVKIE